ncbi:MAG: hypothetical protein PSY14_17465 [bacterium]|nr:hypothetical protein [bacterium]MDI1229469.1 hypothetical protein [bacterium]
MKKNSETNILDVQTPVYWAKERPCLTGSQLDSFIKKFSAKPVKNSGPVFRDRLNSIYSHLLFQLELCQTVQVVAGKKKKASPKLSTIVKRDVKQMREAFECFVEACEGMSDITKEFLTDRMIQKSSRFPHSAGTTFSSCLVKTLGSFEPVLEASAMDIVIKKGQDPAPLKGAIYALADLYSDMIGKKPSRSYDGEKIAGVRGKGETGQFLEFVRAFTALIPAKYGVKDQSLAGHVRQVCDSPR